MKPAPKRHPCPNATPCERCGELPDAMSDEFGYTVFHLCGIVLRMAANYDTLDEATAAWNKKKENQQ